MQQTHMKQPNGNQPNEAPRIDPATPQQPANDPPPNELPEVDPDPNEFPLESPTAPDTERKNEIRL